MNTPEVTDPLREFWESEGLAAYTNEIRVHEREECAKIADQNEDAESIINRDFSIADAIRARASDFTAPTVPLD